MPGKKATDEAGTDERVSKTFTLPPLMIKWVRYFRIDHGFKSDSYALEHLLRAGIAAEEAQAEREQVA